MVLLLITTTHAQWFLDKQERQALFSVVSSMEGRKNASSYTNTTSSSSPIALMFLYVEKDNVGARKFYENRGYSKLVEEEKLGCDEKENMKRNSFGQLLYKQLSVPPSPTFSFSKKPSVMS